MPPRPTPEDSLFAEEKPYLPSRGGTLTLSGLDTNLAEREVWDDEELGGGPCIELTRSCCQIDPLVAATTPPPVAASANTAAEEGCENDAELAALMQAEWNKAEAMRPKKTRPPRRVEPDFHAAWFSPTNALSAKYDAEQKCYDSSQKVLAFCWLLLVVSGLVGLGVYHLVN